MWNSYGLELGWVGLVVLAFGLVLFLVDLYRGLRARSIAATATAPAAEGIDAEAVPDLER